MGLTLFFFHMHLHLMLKLFHRIVANILKGLHTQLQYETHTQGFSDVH